MSAVVENALDVVVAIAGTRRKGHATGVRDGGEDVCGGLPIAQAVLDVHGQPVEAAAGHEARGSMLPRDNQGTERRACRREACLRYWVA